MNEPTRQLIVPAIGSQLAGGTCLGHVFVAGSPFALIVPPRTVFESSPALRWNKVRARIDGALSYFDGLANTRAMSEAGSELATWACDQRLEGFDDWYIAPRQDALVVEGNARALEASPIPAGWYWTSTQLELRDDYAWLQYFGGYGDQLYVRKSNEYRALLLRR